MLGVALTAQRAGWSAQPFVVAITNDVVITQEIYQTPSYSFLVNNTSRAQYIGAGDFDLTGYSGISGFNNRRFTALLNIYLTWPSGLSQDFSGTPISVLFRQTGQANVSHSLTLNTVTANSLQITADYNGGANSIVLTGPYTDYTSRWLTMVHSQAETNTVYTNWSGGSGTNNCRLAIFDTKTGDLIAKSDYTNSVAVANISAYGNSVSSVGTDADSVDMQSFGADPGGTAREFRQAGYWFSYGTMFDPLSVTSDVWRTTRPGNVISNATAWLNSTATTYLDVDPEYFMDQDTDIFIPDTADERWRLTNSGNVTFNAAYSTTIIPKDSS